MSGPPKGTVCERLNKLSAVSYSLVLVSVAAVLSLEQEADLVVNELLLAHFVSSLQFNIDIDLQLLEHNHKLNL